MKFRRGSYFFFWTGTFPKNEKNKLKGGIFINFQLIFLGIFLSNSPPLDGKYYSCLLLTSSEANFCYSRAKGDKKKKFSQFVYDLEIDKYSLVCVLLILLRFAIFLK